MNQLLKAAKISLAVVWIFTGLTSLFFAPEIGYQILAGAGITGELADVLVYAGSITDILLGIWVLSLKFTKLCCVMQIVVILSYSLLLTIMDASFWLHPFGPLIKNIPIIILILFIFKLHEKPVDHYPD